MGTYRRGVIKTEKRAWKQKKEKGYTMLEVLVAISILSFGLLSLASMQVAAINGNSGANRLTEATTWAQDKLEDLMALPGTHADLSNGNHGPQTAASGNNNYTIDWNVVDNVNPGDPIDNAKLVTVTVRWQQKGAVRTTQLFYIRPGLL